MDAPHRVLRRPASRPRTLLVGFALAAVPALCSAQRAPSAVAPAEEGARAAFDEGVARARESRWAESLAAFQRSRALVDRPRTALNVALALRQLGRLRDARQTLRECLAMPAASSEPDVARDAALLLNVVVDAIATLTLTVSADPLTARVDGVVAPVPRQLELDPGEHLVELASPGRVTERFTVEVAPGARVSRSVELRPEPASLALSATPADARLYVDGALIGRGSAAWSGPPGERRVRAAREGYVDLSRAVTLSPGERATESLTLSPRPRPLASRPWFWVGVGVAAAVIAGATTAAVLLAPGEPAYTGGSTGTVLRAF